MPDEDPDRGDRRRPDHGRTRRALLRVGGASLSGIAGLSSPPSALGARARLRTGDGDRAGTGHEDVLFREEFESTPLGPYAPESSGWGGFEDPPSSGTEKHLEVVTDPDRGRVVESVYPAGVDGAGNGNGGGDFRVGFDRVYDELYLAYRVRFRDGFEFRQPGGKLPGLIGTNGEGPITGGDDPDGENGWSARMMWRDPEDPEDGGLVEFYVYHPDQPGEYGDDMYWDDGDDGQVYFRRGEWHTVEHRVRTNTPGENDGVLEGWFDGEKAFERRDLRFRDVAELGIDQLYFSSFFGGGQTEHWAHTRREHIDYDEFVVSTAPIDLDDDPDCRSVPEAVAGEDGRVSDAELLAAIEHWREETEVPGTCGKTVSDAQLLELIRRWRTGAST